MGDLREWTLRSQQGRGGSGSTVPGPVHPRDGQCRRAHPLKHLLPGRKVPRLLGAASRGPGQPRPRMRTPLGGKVFRSAWGCWAVAGVT